MYRAFFSYSRADDRVANWLHGQLDRYRTPGHLVHAEAQDTPIPEKLHPIFRDRTDMSGGGQLTERIEQALKDSESLVVLCSPASAASIWVNREVETFIEQGKGDRIFPVIAAQLPDSANVETEFFPPALRGRGLLAADLREIRTKTGKIIGDGREGGKLKLIAGLLGVSLDALTRRERARQRAVLMGMTAAAVVFAAVAVAAVGLGLLANANAERARNSLARIFAERSWQAIERQDYFLAARYALAGWSAAPVNENFYRAPLNRIMHDLGESTPLIHSSGLLKAEYSSDGQRIVTQAFDGISIWDAARRQRLARIEGDNLTFTLSPDGAFLVTTAPRGPIATIWDARNGRRIAELRGHVDHIWSVAISSDSRRIVTAGADGTARVWNAHGDAVFVLPHRDIETGGGASVRTAAFSPDGSRIATGANDGGARIWDAATGHQLALLAHPRVRGILGQISVESVAFNRDGNLLVTAAQDDYTHLWDLRTNRQIRVFNGDPRRLQRAWFSPSGARIVTLSGDGVQIWNTAGGSSPLVFIRNAQAIAYDRQGARLVTAEGLSARVLDTEGNEITTLLGQNGLVESVAFSPDGTSVLTAGSDGVARIWRLLGGRELLALRGHVGTHYAGEIDYEPNYDRNTVWSADFSADNSLLTTNGDDNTTRVWDARTGEQLFVYRYPTPSTTDPLSADGLRFDVTDDQQFLEAASRIPRLQNLVRASANANGYRIGVRGDRVLIWDAATGLVQTTLRYPNESFTSAAFSPDHTRIVTGSSAGAAHVWNVVFGSPEYGRVVLDLTHGAPIDSVVFSPDGRRIVTSASAAAIIWDSATGHQLQTVRDNAASVEFSPDGTRLLTAGYNGAAIWDVASGRELARLLAAPDEANDLRSAAFSPDGRMVATAGNDGVARIWDVSRLTQPMPALARDACENLLLPAARHFQPDEVGADQLIADVWPLRERGDVCQRALAR